MIVSFGFMNMAVTEVVPEGVALPRGVVGLRKCGVELPKIITAIIGTKRQSNWRMARGVGHPDLMRFAFILADERMGRG